MTEGPASCPATAWYLLYAGGTCCRPPCSYVEAAARSTSLTGPYVKQGTPWLTGGPELKCPGHGTVLDDGARGTWLVHHAYQADDVGDARRLMVASPLTFGADGWPMPVQAALHVSSAGAQAPSGEDQAPAIRRAAWSDGFGGRALAPGWQWLWDRVPAATVRESALQLGCSAPASAPVFVARQAVVDRFVAVVGLHRLRGRWPLWLAMTRPECCAVWRCGRDATAR